MRIKTLNTTNLVLSRHIIRKLHISHNAFSVSLGTAVIPKRNEKQRLCKILGGGGGGRGANKVHYGRCAGGV